MACQAPLSMEFSKQEYWSGLQFPFPDLHNPAIEPRSPFSPAHDSPNQMALLCLLTTQKGWPRSNERSSLVSQLVKSLPAIRETRVQSLGQEDPLEKEITIHYSVLAWRIPWTEEPGGLQSMG